MLNYQVKIFKLNMIIIKQEELKTDLVLNGLK